MKKWLTMLAVFLMLPVLACAQELCSITELREQANAMGGRWSKTYEAHGRTIEIDIPIVIPDVDTCPAVTVVPLLPLNDAQAQWVEDHAKRVNEAYFYTLTGEEPGCEGRAGDEIRMDFRSFFSNDYSVAARSYMGISCNEDDLYGHTTKFGVAEAQYAYDWDLDQDTAYAEENPLTLREAKQILAEAYERLFPDKNVAFSYDQITIQSRLREGNLQTVTITGGILEGSAPGIYHLEGNQLICGIPIQKFSIVGNGWLENGGIDPWCTAQVLSDRVFQLSVPGAAQIRSIEYEDLPLASLQDIIAAAEAEIDAGHIREVYALRLTYGMFHDVQDKSFLWLCPTWTLECAYVDDANKEIRQNVFPGYDDMPYMKKFEFAELPMLAQTAELKTPAWIDAEWDKSSLERFPCPEILLWADAGK